MEEFKSCQLRCKSGKEVAGKGGFVEHWVPSPRRSEEQRTEALHRLSDRCKQQQQSTKASTPPLASVLTPCPVAKTGSHLLAAFGADQENEQPRLVTENPAAA